MTDVIVKVADVKAIFFLADVIAILLWDDVIAQQYIV